MEILPTSIHILNLWLVGSVEWLRSKFLITTRNTLALTLMFSFRPRSLKQNLDLCSLIGFCRLCVYPLDTLKFRMQCNVEAKGLHGNALILATAKKMYLDGGFRAAYRGLTMGMCGMFPYAAIDLGTFEFLKSTIIAYNAKAMNLPEDHNDVYPGSLATGCIGAFSGAFGASVVYPLNLLRTRLQAQGTILHPQTYAGVVDCVKKTVSREGFHGLYKGLTPNLLKVVPAVSITYVVYENSKRILKLH
jgi:solute carrier family 25 phosphate transporter 23/24/25/41